MNDDRRRELREAFIEAMRADCPSAFADAPVLRVDGGMAGSEPTMQFLSDILAMPVERPKVMETTAVGAAYLAGRAAGLCPDLDAFAARWQCERRFVPRMDAAERDRPLDRVEGGFDPVARVARRERGGGAGRSGPRGPPSRCTARP